MKEPIPSELPGQLHQKIRSGLLRAHSKWLDTKDPRTGLNEAYDVYATELSRAGKPLSESLLREKIPAWVFQWAVAQAWLIYPPRRIANHKGVPSPGKYRSSHEPIPEAQLTVDLGVYKVTDWYKADIMRKLESRIVYWEAESLRDLHHAASPVESIGSESDHAKAHARMMVNLTDQQRDLLQLLVSKHQSGGGNPFIFVRSHTSAGIVYPGGDSVPVSNDELDFHQLQREDLITFIPVAPNQWRGKPTERGIMVVRSVLVPVKEWTSRVRADELMLLELGENPKGKSQKPGRQESPCVESKPAPAAAGRQADETPSRPKRGPTPDYATALRVAEIVKQIAGDGGWRSMLDDICLELDDRGIPRPKTWKERGHNGWLDCSAGERHLVVKDIEHHLKLARENPETFS